MKGLLGYNIFDREVYAWLTLAVGTSYLVIIQEGVPRIIMILSS